MPRKTVVLIVLDGWGLSEDPNHNAIALADTPCFRKLWQNNPHTQLRPSGKDVGLPPGIMGNSEVGHLNLGAGRVVQQEVSRINQAIASGAFFENEALTKVVAGVRERNTRLHLVGLMSDGLVHSAQEHYLALIDLARRFNITGQRTSLHAILDGRDTAPQSAQGFLAPVMAAMREHDTGQVASVSGRYYAMDRDNRWERVQKAFDAIVHGWGEKAASADQAISNAYERGETDEFALPTVVGQDGAETPVMADGDGLVFFNYRADRGRELLRALTAADFTEFDRGALPKIDAVSMTRYDSQLPVPFAFQPPGVMLSILGEVVGANGLRQLRVAETEKYAHVTYFFNGGRESPFDGEDRTLVPSPKWVATYDEQPEMSAPAVAWKVVEALRSEQYDFILVNFANPDMVGHTGSIGAAAKAVEAVDWGLGNILNTVAETGGLAVVTADHGNAELMVNPETGNPHTAHTTNPVPFIVVDGVTRELRATGRLADVAPTVLGMMGIPQPQEMTGEDLRIN